MKLYHYAPKDNTIMTEGLLSFSKSKTVDVRSYTWRGEGLKTKKDVCQWMEKCFVGRSRGIRCLTEPMKWYEHSIKALKNFAEEHTLISINVDELSADGLIESVYVSPPIQEIYPQVFTDPDFNGRRDEIYIKLNSVNDIDYSPIDWSICDDEKGWRFAFVRYYLLTIKGGIIPPKYLEKV